MFSSFQHVSVSNVVFHHSTTRDDILIHFLWRKILCWSSRFAFNQKAFLGKSFVFVLNSNFCIYTNSAEKTLLQIDFPDSRKEGKIDNFIVSASFKFFSFFKFIRSLWCKNYSILQIFCIFKSRNHFFLYQMSTYLATCLLQLCEKYWISMNTNLLEIELPIFSTNPRKLI